MFPSKLVPLKKLQLTFHSHSTVGRFAIRVPEPDDFRFRLSYLYHFASWNTQWRLC